MRQHGSYRTTYNFTLTLTRQAIQSVSRELLMLFSFGQIPRFYPLQLTKLRYHLGTSNTSTRYLLNNEELAAVNEVTDLGYTCSDKFDFSEYCKHIKNKVTLQLLDLHRCFHSRNLKVILKANKHKNYSGMRYHCSQPHEEIYPWKETKTVSLGNS